MATSSRSPFFFAVNDQTWEPDLAYAARGGYWIRLVAQPVGLEIRANGTMINCNGAGTIVNGSNYDTASRECSNFYTTSGSKPVTVRVKYVHTYTSNFTPNVPFPVGETSFSLPANVDLTVKEVVPVLTAAS